VSFDKIQETAYILLQNSLCDDVEFDLICLQTLSTSDLDTEKADAVFCHSNLTMDNVFSFINLSELSATIVANSSSEIFGERDTIK
jgi:hypothetical protein